MRVFRLVVPVLVVLCSTLPSTAAEADPPDVYLCSAMLAVECLPDGECDGGPPWGENVPLFMEMNLAEKTLSTPPAVSPRRVTKLEKIVRENGRIVLQGIDQGRVWSWTVDEPSGILRVTVIADDEVVVVFGACTPVTGY